MANQSTTEVSHLTTRLQSKALPFVLRNVELADAPRFSAILSDPANHSDPNASTLDVATATAAITKMRESAAVPTVLDTASGQVISGPGRVNMVLQVTGGGEDDGLVIGLGGYGCIKDWERDGRPLRAGDLGAMIDPKYRGKGYAAEAFRLAIDWAFTPASEGGPQLDLVTITTNDDNEAMVKLADDKLKLKGRGVHRKDPEGGEGAGMEMYWELTKKDWQEVCAQ